MRAGLQQIIVSVSMSAWRYALVVLVAVGTFAALSSIGATFPAVAGGAQPFDLQNGLTTAEVYTQLAGWSPAAFAQYYRFSAIDWVFPLAAGLFLAATVAWCLRRSLPRAYAFAITHRLLPFLLIATACDWLENSFALGILATYPVESDWLPAALVAAKRAKLGALLVTQPLMFGLLLYTAGRALVSWVARARRSP